MIRTRREEATKSVAEQRSGPGVLAGGHSPYARMMTGWSRDRYRVRMTLEPDPSPRQSARRTAIGTALVTGIVLIGAALFSQLFGQSDETINVAAPADATVSSASSLVDAAEGATTTIPLASAEPQTTALTTVLETTTTVSATADATSSTIAPTTSAATTTAATTTTAPTTTVTTTTAPTTTAPTTTSPATSAPATTTTIPATVTTGVSLSPGQSPCPAADGSSKRVATFTVAPPMCIKPTAKYRAVMKTSEGTLTIALDAANAPQTVNNFVYLSRYHFYDGLTFHRVVPNFVIQGGDPLGNGLGTAGYEFADELPPKGKYIVGALAMANGNPGQPNTNSSQFFIVVGNLAEGMDPDFPLFGTVVDGKSVLKKIAALGPDPDADKTGKPSKAITIESVTITARGE